jgi:hypothetical protein
MRRMESLTWAQVRARRLARSYLHEPALLERLGEVVGEVCGIHAQVASSAELQLQARIAGVDVRAELWEQRSLVKSYGPRGTLHLLPRDEVPLWAAANAWEVEPWYERHGFTRRKADAIVAAVGKALDGCELTRAELAAAVGRKDPRVRELLGSGWAYLLGPAAAKGLLCFGPPRGAAVTFVRADQWLGGWDERDPEESMLEIVKRFVRAYGPTTHAELADWLARKPGQAKALLDRLELEQVEVEGTKRWVLTGDTVPDEEPSALRLVPQYDVYVVGSRPRDQLMSPAARERISSFRRGIYEGAVALATVLYRGRIAGLWERKAGRVAVEAFERLPKRALGAEAHRLGGELELRVLE